MIRYPITKQQLTALIDAEKPDWRTRADVRTEGFRTAGAYKEDSNIWGEIKAVYMRIQGNKCAYCERELEGEDVGKVEHDVEHFRPKSNVKPWSPKKLTDLGIAFTAPEKGKGYHLLPYHFFNYAVACKPCNSTLKSDRFPVGGPYNLTGEDPAKLKSEKQYLLFPIGDIDDDPETIIEFQGTSPKPVAKTGKKRNRALVTIEFFKLDDPVRRKFLYRDRAYVITALYTLLKETTEGTTAERNAAKAEVDNLLTPALRHLNCARSFKRLFENDPDEAAAVFRAARKFLSTIS